MQRITPELTLGGMGTLFLKGSKLNLAYGIVYNPQEYILAAQWDNAVSIFIHSYYYFI